MLKIEYRTTNVEVGQRLSLFGFRHSSFDTGCSSSFFGGDFLGSRTIGALNDSAPDRSDLNDSAGGVGRAAELQVGERFRETVRKWEMLDTPPDAE
jgi:hypothetical protein